MPTPSITGKKPGPHVGQAAHAVAAALADRPGADQRAQQPGIAVAVAGEPRHGVISRIGAGGAGRCPDPATTLPRAWPPGAPGPALLPHSPRPAATASAILPPPRGGRRARRPRTRRRGGSAPSRHAAATLASWPRHSRAGTAARWSTTPPFPHPARSTPRRDGPREGAAGAAGLPGGRRNGAGAGLPAPADPRAGAAGGRQLGGRGDAHRRRPHGPHPGRQPVRGQPARGRGPAGHARRRARGTGRLHPAGGQRQRGHRAAQHARRCRLRPAHRLRADRGAGPPALGADRQPVAGRHHAGAGSSPRPRPSPAPSTSRRAARAARSTSPWRC